MKKRGISVEKAEQIRRQKGLGVTSKLQQIRVKKGISQRELAELADIPLYTLQKYEQKKLNIDTANIYTLLKLSVALQCSMCEFIENEELLKELEKERVKK